MRVRVCDDLMSFVCAWRGALLSQAAVTMKEGTIAGQAATIDEQVATIGELAATIGEQAATIGEQAATIGEQAAAIARKDGTIAGQAATIAEQAATIGEQAAAIARKDATIAGQARTTAELEGLLVGGSGRGGCWRPHLSPACVTCPCLCALPCFALSSMRCRVWGVHAALLCDGRLRRGPACDSGTKPSSPGTRRWLSVSGSWWGIVRACLVRLSAHAGEGDWGGGG